MHNAVLIVSDKATWYDQWLFEVTQPRSSGIAVQFIFYFNQWEMSHICIDF